MINYKHLPDCPCPVNDPTVFNYMFDSSEAIHISHPTTALSESFVQWLAERNMFPSFLEIFYLPVRCTVRRIHTDLDHITDRASKINYIIGGEDAPMQWFEVKNAGSADTNYAPDAVRKGSTSPFLHWTRDECTLLEEVVLHGSNLVHAGIPHVVFTKTKPRIAISVVLKDMTSKQRLTCEEVVSRL